MSADDEVVSTRATATVTETADRSFQGAAAPVQDARDIDSSHHNSSTGSYAADFDQDDSWASEEHDAYDDSADAYESTSGDSGLSDSSEDHDR